MTDFESIDDVRKRHAELLGELEDLYGSHPELQEEPTSVFRALSQESADVAAPDLPEPGVIESSPVLPDAGIPAGGEEAGLPEPPEMAPTGPAPPGPVSPGTFEGTLPDVPSEFESEAVITAIKGEDPGLVRPAEPPKDLNLDDAYSMGMRDPERDDVRETGDLASNMQDYNRNLMGLLKEMQDILIYGVAEMEQMRNRFHRMQ